jgi:two-component system nitrogen regulation sensor histidine kinase GlnL
VPALLSQKIKEGRPASRIFLWTLLGIFNAFLWLMLLAFHWEISLRARERQYFGTQLFPLQAPRGLPLSVLYISCALLTLASAAAIWRYHSNLTAKDRLRTLLFQILDSLEIGVVVLDDQDQLTITNDSARRLLPELSRHGTSLDILGVLQDRQQLREMVKAAARHANYQREVEQDLGKPEDPLPVRVTTLPLKDPHGRTTGTLLLVQDVRDALRMERQMRIAERLSALGTLAAAMAHEIRNPLEALDLNLALLERNLATVRFTANDGEKTDKYVKILESEIARLAGIVENFLSFARPSESPVAEIYLEAVLRQIVDLLSNQAQSRRITLDLSVAGTPVVWGSEDQMKQALLNLAINSLEAMPQGGALRIRAEASRQTGSGGGTSFAVVSFHDTGVGIPQEQLERLFDPFFTTRPKGTGLGLTIVQRVIHEHHGRISVSSVLGQGSTFTIELPLIVSEFKKEAAYHV